MNLLVTGAAHPTEADIAALRRAGHAVWVLQNEQEVLPIPAADVEGVVCNALFLHHDIAQFTALRYIQATAVGLDRLPLDHIRERNITLHNAGDIYAIPMAEFAVAAVLRFYKQHAFFQENQAAHRWEKHRNLSELYGKTVCIVGCGHVGTACAVRFAAFGCTVIGVDALSRDDAHYTQIYPAAALSDVLKRADVLLLTLPLTPQTYHLISEKELSLLKDGCVLVNVSRGAVVDTAALSAALGARSLFAALDVAEQEPLPSDSPLWESSQVFITPHNSFVGEHNHARLWRLICENLRKQD